MPSLEAAESIPQRYELHGLQPVLPVADVSASAAFFALVLGFEVDFLYGTPPTHGRVKAGDGSEGQAIFIHLSQAQPEAIYPSGELRIHVGRNLDALCDEYTRRGAQVISPPTTQPWGLREFVLREPNGHLFRFCAEA